MAREGSGSGREQHGRSKAGVHGMAATATADTRGRKMSLAFLASNALFTDYCFSVYFASKCVF